MRKLCCNCQTCPNSIDILHNPLFPVDTVPETVLL